MNILDTEPSVGGVVDIVIVVLIDVVLALAPK